MEKKEKQEFLVMMRTEMRLLEDRIDRKFGVLWENINDKSMLILEAIGDIHKKLDLHKEMFVEVHVMLEKKADVAEVDLLDRRVTKLEGKTVRPSRSG